MRRLLLLLPVLLLALAGCKFTADDGSSITANCPGFPASEPTAVTSGSCSWTASPAPTTTAPTTTTAPSTTTTTTTVPPTTTTTSTQPAGAFPTVATTGAPANQTYVVKPGGTTITTPNLVINGWHVTGDLLVDAPGVQISNSWIEGYLDNESAPGGGARMTVTDTTVGPATGCDYQLPGVGEHDYTATRVKITNHGDGFRVSGSNVTIQDSISVSCNNSVNHNDAMQAYCPGFTCDNVLIDHNTLDVYNSGDFNAPVFGGDTRSGAPNGHMTNTTISNNLLSGGVFTFYVSAESGTKMVSSGNAFVAGRGYYGLVSTSGTCSKWTWSNNYQVNIDANYGITSTGAAVPCTN